MLSGHIQAFQGQALSHSYEKTAHGYKWTFKKRQNKTSVYWGAQKSLKNLNYF